MTVSLPAQMMAKVRRAVSQERVRLPSAITGGLVLALVASVAFFLLPVRRHEIGKLDSTAQHRKLHANDSWSSRCHPPRLNLSAAPLGQECTVFSDVCFDESTVILYGNEYSPANPDVKPLPNFTVTDIFDNWVGLDNVIGDVFEAGASLPHPNLTIRMHSRAEATKDLQDPVFNECRVPLIIWYDYIFNYFETVVHAVSRVHMVEADDSMSRDVDLVVATPWGQALKSYHSELLQPFTSHEITSFADFSSRVRAHRLRSGTAKSAANGKPGRCFKKALLCKWKRAEYWDSWNSMQWVDNYHRPTLRQWEEHTKMANWRFNRGSTLKVLFEDRGGPVRNILNAKELVDKCNAEKHWHIDKESRFRSISCSFVRFTNKVEENAGAVRNVHVLVGVHGSGLTNSLFMRHGSALLEILPYNFTECCAPHDRFYPQLMRWSQDAVHYWSISIEDPDAFKPGEFEKARVSRVGQPNHFDFRDRHVILRWDALKDALERIASVNLLWERYTKVREENGQYLAMTSDDVMTLKDFRKKFGEGPYKASPN